MTRAGRRRNAALLVVSPAAVGVLTLTTAWALEHSPQQPATPQVVHRSPAGATVQLQAQLRATAKQVQQSQVRLLRLDAALRDRSDSLRRLAATVRGADTMGRSSPATSGSYAGGNVAVPPPPPVAVPAAPPVSTTTGAS